MASYLGKYTGSFKPDSDLIQKVEDLAKINGEGKKYIELSYVTATEENIRPFGSILRSREEYDSHVINILKWPSPNGRPVNGGQGGGDTGSNEFISEWIDDKCFMTNHGVDGHYNMGWRHNGHLFSTDMNFHPDGDQLFWPLHNQPYIIMLGNHRDETTVTPMDFIAFYCDGSFGLVVNPGTYHNAVFPFCDNKTVCLTRQGQVHGNVVTDFFDEYGVYIGVENAFKVPQSTELPAHIDRNPAPLASLWATNNRPRLPKELATEMHMHIEIDHVLGQILKDMNVVIVDELWDVTDIERVPWPARYRPMFKGDEERLTDQNIFYSWKNGQLYESFECDQATNHDTFVSRKIDVDKGLIKLKINVGLKRKL